MSFQPKRTLARLKTCPHGGIDFTELRTLGIKSEDIIDFSVSTNPFMPPPGILESIQITDFDRYPDSKCTELTYRLAEKLGLLPGRICIGSGTTELIRHIAMTYFRNRDRILILEPTYGEYEIASLLANTRLLKYQAHEEDNFTPNISDIKSFVRKYHPRAVFICNPNNPTGKYLSRQEIEEIVNEMEESLLILDEAYASFVRESWNSFHLTERENIIILRSMTKDYSLPGLRLGYAVACPEIINSIHLTLPPWNVNGIAQRAGIVVLEQEEYLRQSLERVREAKQFLTDEISRLGFKIVSSDTHYFLVRVGNASNYRLSLLKHGILVRDCTSFGLPEYIRISPRTLPECKKLIDSISNLTPGGNIE